MSEGEAERSLGNKLKKLGGESPSDVNMIDLEAKGTLKGAWCRDTQHTRKRRPKDSYASVPLDAVSRVKFRVKSELGCARRASRAVGEDLPAAAAGAGVDVQRKGQRQRRQGEGRKGNLHSKPPSPFVHYFRRVSLGHLGCPIERGNRREY